MWYANKIKEEEYLVSNEYLLCISIFSISFNLQPNIEKKPIRLLLVSQSHDTSCSSCCGIPVQYNFYIRCNRYQLCIHLVYLIKWKQSDDFYLYLTMSPMYKDNLCRSKLIKVRLFDEVFFRFFVQRWYLCEALITHPDATGTKMLDLSHTLISHQLLYPTNILSFFPVNADYDCVSASSN